MKQLAIVMLALLLLPTAAHAQALSVTSSTVSDVLKSDNTATDAQDRNAVHGVSKPQSGYGRGGYFEGGSTGVLGEATVSGTTGNRYAVKANARYGSNAWGVYATAFNGGNNYGVYGVADYGTNNFGVMGYAPTNSTSWAGYFGGNVYVSGSITQTSDLTLKFDIQDLPDGALLKVLSLKPKTYRFDPNKSAALRLSDSKQIGLIAQDVAPILPEAVSDVVVADPSQATSDTESKKIKTIDYIKLIPVLIKAIQEQQVQIETLKAEIAALK